MKKCMFVALIVVLKASSIYAQSEGYEPHYFEHDVDDTGLPQIVESLDSSLEKSSSTVSFNLDQKSGQPNFSNQRTTKKAFQTNKLNSKSSFTNQSALKKRKKTALPIKLLSQQ